tara:strand:+ start:119 stop:406 length:288 start_codon:yes stop_codon:yes gene_type:complete
MVKSTKKPGRPKKTTAKKPVAKKPATVKKEPTISKGDSKKAKGVSLFGLGKKQQDAMVKHSQHHSKKHIRMMKDLMVKGDTFAKAHTKTQKKVGK